MKNDTSKLSETCSGRQFMEGGIGDSSGGISFSDVFAVFEVFGFLKGFLRCPAKKVS